MDPTESGSMSPQKRKLSFSPISVTARAIISINKSLHRLDAGIEIMHRPGKRQPSRHPPGGLLPIIVLQDVALDMHPLDEILRAESVPVATGEFPAGRPPADLDSRYRLRVAGRQDVVSKHLVAPTLEMLTNAGGAGEDVDKRSSLDPPV